MSCVVFEKLKYCAEEFLINLVQPMNFIETDFVCFSNLFLPKQIRNFQFFHNLMNKNFTLEISRFANNSMIIFCFFFVERLFHQNIVFGLLVLDQHETNNETLQKLKETLHAQQKVCLFFCLNCKFLQKFSKPMR